MGIEAKAYFLEEDITENYMLDLIEKLNNPEIDGIMLNLPLPKHIDATKVLNKIKLIKKDVNGFKAENLGLLFQNSKNFISPSTPAGIMEMLKRYEIDLKGKDVVVVGRSNIVWKTYGGINIKCSWDSNYL